MALTWGERQIAPLKLHCCWEPLKQCVHKMCDNRNDSIGNQQEMRVNKISPISSTTACEDASNVINLKHKVQSELNRNIQRPAEMTGPTTIQ